MSPIEFRKRLNLGPIRFNVSRSGVSWTIHFGPWSWNSRTRANRVDLPGPLFWRQRRRTRREPGDQP